MPVEGCSVCAVVQIRKKDSLALFWSILQQEFGDIERTPPESRPLPRLDGLLFTFGSVYDVLMHEKKYKRHLEGAISKFILPAFDSPAPFLRLRCVLCAVASVRAVW